MRYKYPTAVVGCILHATLLTGWFYWTDPSADFNSKAVFSFMVLSLIWPAWYFVLRFSAPKAKKWMIFTPMGFGLVILFPMLRVLLPALGVSGRQ
jgi:hypothetical protein